MSLADLIVSLAFLAQFTTGGTSDPQLFARHLANVSSIPTETALSIHQAASTIGIDPLDLAATCITEHTGRVWDLSIEGALRRERDISYGNKDGAAGEVGLCQVSPSWILKIRRNVEELEELSVDEMRDDPYLNALAAAFVVSEAKRRHAEHGDDDPIAGPHDWIAHYKCAPYRRSDPTSGRGNRCGTCGYGKRKWERARLSIVRVLSPVELLEEHKAIWFRFCYQS